MLYSGSHAHDCSSMGEFPDRRRHHLLAESVDDPKLLGWFPDTNDGLGEADRPARDDGRRPPAAPTTCGSAASFTTVNGDARSRA